MSDINERIGNILNEMSDEKNPQYLYSTTDSSLLVAIATGKLDAKDIAKFELENRGLGKNGKWVGFPESEKIWKAKFKGK